MNKTVNINLANILFHIDEDAYNKMRRYLDAVKRSFTKTPGSDEILADIEARIAELFGEKMKDARQVITSKEVDEVIAIMGQPEDYVVDEDIFEDEKINYSESKSKTVKKLYRDTDMKYVAGVSSGLAHYIGVDPLWVRLLWVILTIGSGGGFIFLYGLLWILIPEAVTTSQKLDMRGEDINISNIERKVKEGFEDVANTIKNVDYDEVGKRVKKGGQSVFDTFGDLISFVFKVFGKFIGIILIIIGGAVIIGMFIGMVTVGTLDWLHIPGVNGFMNNMTSAPIWLLSMLFFFVIGIPFFFLQYLGFKILVTNLKSIGSIAKFSLLGLWLISLITLIVLGVREMASHAYEGGSTNESELYLEQNNDTLQLKLASSQLWDNGARMRIDNSIVTEDDNDQPILVSKDVRFTIKKATDSILKIVVRKEANGASLSEARNTAQQIDYKYELNGNSLLLDDYLTVKESTKFKDQEVRGTLYLPAGTYLRFSSESDRDYIIRSNKDADVSTLEGFLWMMGTDGELKCQNCPSTSIDYRKNDDNKVEINANGIDINVSDQNGESVKVKVDENGIDIKTTEGTKNNVENDDSFEMKIDQNGVKIKNPSH